jgi:hypothetical protein
MSLYDVFLGNQIFVQMPGMTINASGALGIGALMMLVFAWRRCR